MEIINHTDYPKAIFFSKKNPDLYRECACDCGDCYVPPPPKIETISLPNDSIYYSAFSTLNLDDVHTLCYSSQDYVGVLNQSALDIAKFFKSPASIKKFPKNWIEKWGKDAVHRIIKSFIESSLLKNEGRQTGSKVFDNPSVLSAWLHITDRCNLRCKYCYLPHHNIDMTFQIGKNCIDAALNSARLHNLETVLFKYSGGEPLLAFDMVEALHKYAVSQAKKYTINVLGTVLSNGTLLNSKILETINTLGLRLMVSLDGIGEPNNKHRPYYDGRGTFNDIVEGIRLAQECDMPPYISVTVSESNAAYLPELVEWLIERDLSFGLNFSRNSNYTRGKISLESMNEALINGLLSTYRKITNNLPSRSLLNSLIDQGRFQGPHLYPCSVGRNYIVFDYLGRISKCQMAMDSPVGSPPILNQDPLSLIKRSPIGINNVSVEDKTGCENCEWKYWCAGGCPYETFKAMGQYKVASPFCAVYKVIYPEVLLLEGKRLLMYETQN